MPFSVSIRLLILSISAYIIRHFIDYTPYDILAENLDLSFSNLHKIACRTVFDKCFFAFTILFLCRRNGIKKLLWKHDKTLVGKTDADGNLVQNMTLHKWFANKACPGAYLEERMFDIAAKVNALL